MWAALVCLVDCAKLVCRGTSEANAQEKQKPARESLHSLPEAQLQPLCEPARHRVPSE